MSGSDGLFDFLVVDDDPVLSQHVGRIVARQFRPRVVASVSAFRELLPELANLQAAIIDFQLPDGTGFDIIDALRAAGVRIPMLLLTAHFDRDVAIAAQDRGAEFAVKPTSLERIEGFLAAVAAAAERRERARRLDIATRIAERHGLSKQEAHLLSLYAAGTARSDLAEAMGVSENTVKTVVRRILWKCGHAELRDLLDAWRDTGSSPSVG